MRFREASRLSLAVARQAWIRRQPFLLYLKPTARCDCRCEVCDRWQRPSRPEEEMPLAAVEEMLARFRRAGCLVLALWGGEPLLRDDLPQILRAAKGLGYRTSMCTNCNRLPDRVDEVAPLLDTLLCSLDGHGDLHDRLRGVQGLFDRAVRGIEGARRFPGCDARIWAALNARNRDQIRPLAGLARELGVGIEFFPISPIAGHNDALLLPPREREDAFAEVRELRRHGFPVRNPYRALEIMRTGRSFRCNFPRISIHVDHRGTVHSCEDPQGTPLHAWGPCAEFDPATVCRGDEFRRVTERLADCNGCRLPCVVEMSGSLPRALAGMFLSRRR